MARVTAGQVKGLIDTNRSVDQFIDVANVYVNEHLVSVISNTAILEKIELYLAAHFTALTEERGGLVESGLGIEVNERYSDIYEAGLKSTRFGQQAMMLDSTGTLANLGANKLRARFRVV